MTQMKSRAVFTLLSGLCSLYLSSNAQAQISIVISTPPPPPAQAVVVEPPGFTNCYFIESGFYDGIWQYGHQVCEYTSGPAYQIWVAGYWQCPYYGNGGICARWRWAPGHWANNYEINYLQPYVSPQAVYISDRGRHGHAYVHGHGYDPRQSYPVHGHPGNGNQSYPAHGHPGNPNQNYPVHGYPGNHNQNFPGVHGHGGAYEQNNVHGHGQAAVVHGHS